MKSVEYNSKQIRIRKIAQELEQILDDLVFEIQKKENLNIGKRLEGKMRGKKSNHFSSNKSIRRRAPPK